MDPISLTSCQAPNNVAVVRALAEYLTDVSGVPASLMHMDLSWEDRHARVDAGQVDVGWICSQPYVLNTDAGSAAYEVLAVPVRSGSRYRDEPVYFSDVIVRAESSAQGLHDLRGARFGYNEPASLSGYTSIKAHLAGVGEDRFFGETIALGSHENAIAGVLAGDIDTAAIDSAVLERALRDDASLAGRLRVVETLGPNPAPPLVVRKSLDAVVRDRLRDAVLAMHEDARGREALADGMLSRFAAVDDAFYDPIRDAYNRSLGVELA